MEKFKPLEQLELFPLSEVQSVRVPFVSGGGSSFFSVDVASLYNGRNLMFVMPNRDVYTYRLVNTSQIFPPV